MRYTMAPTGASHRHLIANFGAQQGLAEGRLFRDCAVHGVGFLRADHLIRSFGTSLDIGYAHFAANGDLILGLVVFIDDHRMLEDVLQLGDTGIQLSLLIFRLIVLAVFGQVTEAAGNLDLLGNLVCAGGLIVFQFLFQFLIARRAHAEFIRSCHSYRSFLFAPPGAVNSQMAMASKKNSHTDSILLR